MVRERSQENRGGSQKEDVSWKGDGMAKWLRGDPMRIEVGHKEDVSLKGDGMLRWLWRESE